MVEHDTHTGELASHGVGAVVLAAGLSTRMGQPKQLMMWGDQPMVRCVVDVLAASGVAASAIVVVVGHRRDEVTEAVSGSAAKTVFNSGYADGSMLRSLQVGLTALLSPEYNGGALPEAALAALGDQPQIKVEVVQAMIAAWRAGAGKVVAPSYGGRRGNPVLFARELWPEILSAPPVGSPRDLLGKFVGRTALVEVDDDSVVRDIDTPEEYRQELARRV